MRLIIGGATGTGNIDSENLCQNFDKQTKTTCNGNGDGIVGYNAITNAGNNYEPMIFVQHLYNFGYVKNIDYSASYLQMLAFKVNLSSNVGIMFGTASNNIPTSQLFNKLVSRSMFSIGKIDDVDGGIFPVGAIDLDVTQNLDYKLDDGLPYTGNTFVSNSGDCSKNENGNIVYDIDNPEKKCALLIYGILN